MDASAIDRIHGEFSDLLDLLEKSNEISLRNTVDDNFRKVLLIAAASYFERRMTDTILTFVAEVTAQDHILTNLVKSKVVNRQYHTWFDWEKRNANRFFAIFGTSFKNTAITEVNANANLESSIKAFIEIGNARNRLVHQDFASFTLEKTSDEIYELYCSAIVFVEWFPQAIRHFCKE